MKISVVIPCRNEVNVLEECVDAIYASHLPDGCSLSVCIVDGKSDDGTLELIARLQARYDSLELITNEMQLTPYAFNLGIRASEGADYVQIVGARQIVDKGYLLGALHVFREDSDIWCVGGRVYNVYLNETGEIIAKAMGTSFGMGLGNFRTLEQSAYVDTVGTPMYPRHVFEKIGLFDEELVRNQDDDFNFRVTQAGGKIFYAHDISIKYYVRGNYKGLWRQFFQYGYWKVYVNRKHKALTTLRQLIPPLFVCYLFTFWLCYFLGVWWGVLASFPLLAYLVLSIYFSVQQSKSFASFVELSKTYWILHLSYGLGYLKGLWEFVLLRRKPSDKQKRLSR